MNLLSSQFFLNIIIGSFAAAAISFVSYKFRLLTYNGAIASFILGGTIFSLGELKWSIPLISFFLFASILSNLGHINKTKFNTVFDKSSRRDLGQVFANGFIGGVLVIINYFHPSELLYIIYLGSLSAVCADTSATEIGTMRATSTYNILTFQETLQGTSGGISAAGSLGALLGTIIIAFSGIYWIHLNLIYYFCVIVFAGLTGAFIDSIIGASIQIQYKCSVCGRIGEKKMHCSKKADHYRGLELINNDVVNFIASLSGCASIYFINVIMKLYD